MTSPTVYLISGANRGIGLGLVTILVARLNTIVFAGARDPEAAIDLNTLVQKFPGKVHIVKLTSCDREDNDIAVREIKRIAGRLDVVIANAGISNYYGSAINTPEDQMREHYNINVVGTHVLFKATYPLLSVSTLSPKFIPISSGAGSITAGASMPPENLAYGASKAAENYLSRKLHFEHPGLICFPMCPGGVATDMAVFASKNDKAMENFPTITVETSASGLLEVIDNSTREKDGGRFLNYNGATWEW